MRTSTRQDGPRQMSARGKLPSSERPSVKARLQSALLTWFATHRRDLPWRAEPRDPYHVWLSEIMLQQTQVATVIPYFQRWLERFPTLKDLAEAPVDDALKLWEGLGYYARARNLHRAAQVVMRDYGGRIPDTLEELLKLPGVGRYTAGAIASIAFGRDAPVLDGNVKRVLSRLYGLTDARSPKAIAKLWQLCESLLPAGRAGPFNEALMELGATVCAPRAPECPRCPIRSACRAFAAGRPEAYPARTTRPPLPHRFAVAAVIEDGNGRVLMAQRQRHGLLGGLWEFPGGDLEPGHDEDDNSRARRLAQLIHERTGVSIRVAAEDFIGAVRHTFTHFRLTRWVARVRLAEAGAAPQHSAGYIAARWVTRKEMSQLALTRSDRKICELAFGRACESPAAPRHS
ncbi:MAG: A/G-specific adenine glycosylase [Candidatus Roseilinea sp.]|uniref:A/G-specific adenine glycosylase n=1 Tax=Candidatus Roseilinea sp. TaxID=2838777 RepID=UPI004049D2A1